MIRCLQKNHVINPLLTEQVVSIAMQSYFVPLFIYAIYV